METDKLKYIAFFLTCVVCVYFGTKLGSGEKEKYENKYENAMNKYYRDVGEWLVYEAKSKVILKR